MKHDKPRMTSAKIKGVSCSCGQLCKNFRGLKLHQIKAKCLASENKFTGPDKRCSVSLTDILNTSLLKFGDTIYYKTPSNMVSMHLSSFVMPGCSFITPQGPSDKISVTGLQVNCLSNTFKKFYGRHTDLVGQYKKNVCQMFADSIS